MTYGTEGGAAGGPRPDPDTARHEAERLVAAGLAALSTAADRIGAPTRERGGTAAAGYDAIGDILFGRAKQRHRVANDSAACCQCPVCKLISAARDPDPVIAERIAHGAGALAENAARVLRTVVGPTERPSDAAGPSEPAEPAEPSGSSEPSESFR